MAVRVRRGAQAVAALALLAVVAATPAHAEDPPGLGGEPVEVSTDPGHPTELTAGLWSDTLGTPDAPDATHQFAYRRTMADSTVHLGVVGASTDDTDALEIAATGLEGTDCGSDTASLGFSVPQAVFGAAVSVGAAELGERDSDCLTAEIVTFTVGRGSSSSDQELPVAIKVVEEAPVVSGLGDLPTTPASPGLGQPGGGSPEPVSGTTSFADAPRLDSGTTYADSVPEGGQRLYRVGLDWGQSLSVRAEVPKQDAAAAKVLEFLEPAVGLELVDPLRDTFTDVVEGGESSGAYGDAPLVLDDRTPPLTYLSRFEQTSGWLPGDYWVSLAVAPADDRDPLDVPVELSVEVSGEASGAPTYAQTVQGPGTAPGPDGYDPATPYLVADGVFSDNPSATVPSEPGDPDGEGPTVRWIAGVALAAVSLLALALGVRRLRRR